METEDLFVEGAFDFFEIGVGWDTKDFPVILCPVSLAPTMAPRADAQGAEQLLRIMGHDLVFIGIFNLLGLPTACVPAGLLDGHPVGVQLAATRFREDVALVAAEAVEAKTGVLAETLWAREAG